MDEPSGGQTQPDVSGAGRQRINHNHGLSVIGIAQGSIDASGGQAHTLRHSSSWFGDVQRQSKGPAHPRTQSSPQSLRYAISIKLGEAIGAAQGMEESAKDSDPIELSISGFKLKTALQELWELRTQRESDWQDLIAMLQAAINKEQFERFGVEQCKTVRVILENHLSNNPVDLSDLESSLRLLRKAALDPWKGVSDKDSSEYE